MKCIDPILCYTRSDGKKIYRNFSFIKDLTLFLSGGQQVFDCGKCLSCRKKKAYELAARCVLHASLYTHNCFLTLTYDEKKDGYHNEFNYSDIQKFKKRLRAHCARVHNKRIEVFNVHEYGKNGKKHWHLIVFNHDFPDKSLYTMRSGIPLYTSKDLEKLWPYGFNTVGDVSEASAMYQAQYMEKDFKNFNTHNDKKSHSKHSGLGRPYFEKHYRQILSLGFVPFNGRKLPLPRYFERLAHRHYCHFYDTSKFFDTQVRKALYRPFPVGGENKEIANLYLLYQEGKKEKVQEFRKNWDDVISRYLTTNEDPDFIKSGNNALYDLRNKQRTEKF